MVKCEECGSPMVWIDAELDITWCEECELAEDTDYKELPQHIQDKLNGN